VAVALGVSEQPAQGQLVGRGEEQQRAASAGPCGNQIRMPDGEFEWFTSTEVVYGVTGTDVTVLPEYGVSP
jgi:hypothetical protein